ncbi:HK97 family phage prohead protease [Paraburkholderia sp. BR14263]|uniref:HK97 family phage prohead protease n=1 Tax=unclassified Paraburkholderia TaxID=2615204 RepID=UPI0034CE912D
MTTEYRCTRAEWLAGSADARRREYTKADKICALASIIIKSADDDRRELAGIASTPQTDRAGDILDPMGCEFRTPLPLLMQHSHEQVIGSVVLGSKTSEGVKFRARIANPETPPSLVDRCESAWESVRTGMLTTVSVGFRPISWEPIEGARGGVKFTRWEWLELSIVAVPCNSDAIITSVGDKARAAGSIVELSEAELEVEAFLEGVRAKRGRVARTYGRVVKLDTPIKRSRVVTL